MRRDRVVLVGCDRGMEDLVQLVVEQVGEARVEQVCGADDAVRLIREHRPAVVIVDDDAPRGAVQDVIQRMGHEPEVAQIPVLALCSTLDEGHHLMAQGAADFVTKPPDVGELVDKVQRLAARGQGAVG